MKKRGRIQEDPGADITIFDPGTDDATAKLGENALPSTGFAGMKFLENRNR